LAPLWADSRARVFGAISLLRAFERDPTSVIFTPDSHHSSKLVFMTSIFFFFTHYMNA